MAKHSRPPKLPHVFWIFLMLSAFISIWGILSFFSVPDSPEKLSLHTYTGSFTEHRYTTWRSGRSASTHRMDYFIVDNLVFHMGSIPRRAFDNSFLTEVQPGQQVTVQYEIVRGGTKTEGNLALVSLSSNGQTYLSAEDVWKERISNSRVGLFIGAIFLIITIVLGCLIIVVNKSIYRPLRSHETVKNTRC